MDIEDDLPTDTPIAAAYALGLLEHEQARDFEALMHKNPDVRAEYVAWVKRVDRLDGDIEVVKPPEHVFQSIDRDVFANDARDGGVVVRFENLGLIASGVLLLVSLFLIWGFIVV